MLIFLFGFMVVVLGAYIVFGLAQLLFAVVGYVLSAIFSIFE